MTKPGGLQSSLGHFGCWEALGAVETSGKEERNQSGYVVMVQLPAHPGPSSRRKFASGEVVHSAWDSTDHWKSVTCSRKDALVPVPQC